MKFRLRTSDDEPLQPDETFEVASWEEAAEIATKTIEELDVWVFVSPIFL